MGRSMLSLALAGLLTACAQQPRIVNAPPPGISYRFHGEDIASANERADKYCGEFGKRAQLQKINRSGSDNIAVYDCS
jgi:hypothetical protein